MARENGMGKPEAEGLIGVAAARKHLGQPAQALNCASRALALARHRGYSLVEADALTVLADLHLVQEQYDQTIELATQALAIHRETGHRLGEAHVVLGHALCQSQGIGAALPYWRSARVLFTEIAAPEADQVRALLLAHSALRSATSGPDNGGPSDDGRPEEGP